MTSPTAPPEQPTTTNDPPVHAASPLWRWAFLVALCVGAHWWGRSAVHPARVILGVLCAEYLYIRGERWLAFVVALTLQPL